MLFLTGCQTEQPPQAYEAPQLSHPDSWTMVVVPDIQFYIKKRRNHGVLDLMFSWLLDARDRLKIQQVCVVGDLVNYNNFGLIRDHNDLVCQEQWKVTSRMFAKLDGELPYILCTGNHDYGVRWSEDYQTFYNDYFTSDRNPLARKQLIECGPNTYGVRTMENAAFEWQAPHPDNRKFLFITLQFAPTDAILKWAKNLAASPRFAQHIGIVMTHSYLSARTGGRIEQENYGVNRAGGNAGEGIFRKLVYPSKNIRLVLSGHVGGPNGWGVAFTENKNIAGKTVAQMVFNTQFVGTSKEGNGGDGWLRLLEFMPDKKTVKARTFSPLFAISPSTRHLAWEKSSKNEFTFILE